ncbi:MAG: rhodanese-like domain-containing protein, partial [Caldilineaceae bacterium]|nr:rhodanese-like domain-containing protein [Caldilineaceae bacterium]
ITMKNRLLLLIAILLIALLSACGGAGGAAAPAAGNDEAIEIDLSTLPEVIDAQTVASIKDMDDVVLIDVREQFEYDDGHIPGITLIPMNSIPSRLNEIPTDKTVVLTCRSGNRSGQVFNYLQQQGFTNIHNMEGGIVAWQAAGLPVEK